MFRRSTPSFELTSVRQPYSERAHEKAQEVLAERIQESDFVDRYSEEEIEADKAEVAKRKLEYEKERTEKEKDQKRAADIFEAIVFEEGEQNYWFGEDGFTICASEYDDIMHGIDILVEFRRPDSPEAPLLTLGVDVTFSRDVMGKFDNSRRQIENGKLSEIKYFASEHSKEKGPRFNLPRVMIGASEKTVNELQELWLDKDQAALLKHRIQIMILKEIEVQLVTFLEYSRSLGDETLAGIFEARLVIIRKILGKKNELFKNVVVEINDDPVYSAIIRFMEEWRRVIRKSQEKRKNIEETDLNKPLTLRESAEVQYALVHASGLQPDEWANKYAVPFRRLINLSPTHREMIRTDQEGALHELARRLYGWTTKKVT